MPQLHCYVSEDIAKRLQAKAESAHLSLSKYLALLVKRDLDHEWPEGYFELFGQWQGAPPERPTPDSWEDRLDWH